MQTFNHTLPEGWSKVQLNNISVINPKKPNKDTIDRNLDVSFIPMKCVEELTGHIDLTNTRKYLNVQKGYTYFENGDIIFAKITPCMENGKVAVVENLVNGIGFGSTEFHVVRFDKNFNKKFYFYYLLQNDFRASAAKHMKGTAGQLRVPTNYIEQALVPLPPLPEQHRIVSKIESIFAQIDACKIRLERLASQTTSAPSSLSQLRSSVLKQAFDGNLTAKWREDNKGNFKTEKYFLKQLSSKLSDNEKTITKGMIHKNGLPVIPATWIWIKMQDVAKVGQGGTPATKNPEFWNGTIPWLRSGEVKNNVITNSKEFITKKGLSNSSTTLCPKGSVLLAMTGEGLTRGRSAILELDACTNQSIAYLILHSSIFNRFLYYYFQSEYWNIRRISKGTSQPGLNVSIIKQFEMPLPILSEQKKIVSKIESIFARIDAMDVHIKSSLNLLDVLKSSVLKQAFEGRLVPQDPNDEPASALLERIKNGSESTPKSSWEKKKNVK